MNTPNLMPPAPYLARQHERLTWRFGWVAALACLVAYPLALLPNFGPAAWELRVPGQWLVTRQYLCFDLALPVTELLAILAVAVILSSQQRLPRWLLVACLVMLGSLLLGPGRYRGDLLPHLELLAMVSLPWAVAVAAARHPVAASILARRLALLLWALQMAYGWWDHLVDWEITGLVGNRNWYAVLLASLCPWAAHGLSQWWPARYPSWLGRVLVWALVLLLSLPLLVMADSRGAWLALALALAACGLERCPARWRWTYFISLSMLLLATVLLLIVSQPQRLASALRQDVRLPLWGRTMAMIKAEPLGVGPGQFRTAFTPYRAASRYSERAVSAPTTIHPHNEWLNLAAQLGLPAALAWLLLLWPLLRPPAQDSPTCRLARFSALVILGGAMVDMTLVRPPASLWGWLMLGLAWTPWLKPAAHEPPAVQARLRAIATSVTILLFLLAATYFGSRAWRYGWAAREARQAEHLGTVDPPSYTRAFELWQRAAAIHPAEPDAWYQAARLAITRLPDPESAAPMLARLEREHPDFAHLNKLLCRLAIKRQDPATALRYAARELALHPFSPEAHHLHWVAAATAGRLDQVPALYDGLLRANLVRLEASHGADLAERLQAWHARWADQAACPEAQALADDLVGRETLALVDPLIGLVAGSEDLPLPLLAPSHHLLDCEYWQFRASLRQLWQAWQPKGAPPVDPLAALAEVRRAFRARFGGTDGQVVGPLGGILPPVGQSAPGSVGSVARACLFLSLVREGGWPGLLYQDDAGHWVVRLLVGPHRVELDLETDVQRPLTPAADWTARQLVSQDEWPRTRFFFLTQEFFLRQSVLGTTWALLQGDDAQVAWQSPSVQVVRALGLDQPNRPAMPPAALRQMLLGGHLQASAKRLRPAAPAP